MTQQLGKPRTVAMALAFLFAVGAGASRATETTAAERVALQKIENKKVCMINEQLFAKDQIPIVVDGKTYYGCCGMCKKALGSDATRRSAIDPVNGLKVDKATAVIGAQPDGRVVYFESEQNLEKYNETAKPAAPESETKTSS